MLTEEEQENNSHSLINTWQHKTDAQVGGFLKFYFLIANINTVMIFEPHNQEINYETKCQSYDNFTKSLFQDDEKTYIYL